MGQYGNKQTLNCFHFSMHHYDYYTLVISSHISTATSNIWGDLLIAVIEHVVSSV